MIKINLAKLKPNGSKPGSSGGEGGDSDNKTLQKQGAQKLIIIILAPFLIYFYEHFIMSSKLPEIIQITNQNSEMKTKIDQANSLLTEVKKLKETEQTKKNTFNSIQSVLRDRLFEVRVLDMIQRKIPTNVWLNRLEFKRGTVTFIGSSQNEGNISEFMDKLSKSPLLKEVNLVKSNEVQSERGSLKQFEMSGQLKKNN